MIYFIFYPFLFTVMRFLVRLFGRLQSSGEGNVPRTGPVIYCPNHLSDADPPTILATVPRRAWFIGKQELFDVPVIGWFWHHFHAFPIKRDSADRTALRQAEDVLKRGEPLVIFPEGRCAQNGKLGKIQPGAVMLSLRTGAPIIPIGVEYTNEMMPYGSLRPRFSKHRVQVTFGPPISPKAYADLSRSAATEAMTRKLGEELARLTHQPPPEMPARRRTPKAAEPAPTT